MAERRRRLDEKKKKEKKKKKIMTYNSSVYIIARHARVFVFDPGLTVRQAGQDRRGRQDTRQTDRQPTPLLVL